MKRSTHTFNINSFNGRISCSTLLETIVSLLLANIVFFFAFTIILNSMSGNFMIREYKAHLKAYSFLTQEMLERNFEDKAIELNNLNLQKKVISVENEPGLLQFEIKVTDRTGKEILVLKNYIRHEKD
ncbi:hypothetical protein SLH46_21005 [Draconibacterium sp. IB214405]|uniref:hypothetical protein n=1 Tax=Draconibacterium sp. IB214405 TaxID=3097352 RepID=UPI002A0EE5D3|nr:hypothetical protein [Draconibacterium sp. IB214405]MDX8341691.1 hypothetical protein [Draconibacterium sp. IB214405]